MTRESRVCVCVVPSDAPPASGASGQAAAEGPDRCGAAGRPRGLRTLPADEQQSR